MISKCKRVVIAIEASSNYNPFTFTPHDVSNYHTGCLSNLP